MLATSFHETARTMQPIEERGKGAGKPDGQRRKYSGAIYAEPDKLFFGRGDVQLTWYENYELMGRSNRGDFTGVSLENYFNANREDPFNARRIINGLDCAKLIEGYYRKFLSALRNSGLILVFVVASSLLILGGGKPKQVVNEQYVDVTDSTAVLRMSDSLQIKEWQMMILKTHLNRFIEENFNLESKTWQKEINYDTTAQIDSVSGRHPVLSEIVSTNIITFEKSHKDHEAMVRVDSIEKTNVSAQSSNIDQRFEMEIDEIKSVKTKSFLRSSLNCILVILCIILFLLSSVKK